MIGTKDNSNYHSKENLEDKTAGTLKTIFHSLGSRPTSASFRKLAALGLKMLIDDNNDVTALCVCDTQRCQSAFDMSNLCKTNSSSCLEVAYNQ